MRSIFRVCLVLIALLLDVEASFSQSGQTVRIIFPFAAGGGADATARMLAEKMSARLNQPFVVENRTGGSGRIGINAVKAAPPDGTTMLFTPFAAMTIYPFTFRALDYDPIADFQPLSQVAEYDFAMAVHPGVPARTPHELAAWLKANPSKASFGSPGAGAIPHFFGILFGNKIGVPMTHIAYRGTSPGIADLVAGHIPIMSTGLADFRELHRAGKIHVIASAGTQRSLPDIPTFKESGFDMVGNGWYGTFLPKGTPPEIVARYNKAIKEIVALPDVKERFDRYGFRATGTSPEQLTAIQKADADLWRPIVKQSGFVAD
jgi:tripartite-type tricarboxylate transporter receptor subunit TctC